MIEFQGTLIGTQKNKIQLTIKDSDFSSLHRYTFPKGPFRFVSIMKNASTSINELVQPLLWDKSKDEQFWFTIVRDPIERFFSTMNYLPHYSVDYLGNCLRQYPAGTSKEFMDDFMHFTPQRIMTNWFESHVDLKFYSIKNLEPLRKEIQNRLSKKIKIPHLNATHHLWYRTHRSRQSPRSVKVEQWVDKNYDFVMDFLRSDYDWYNSLKIES